LFNSRCYSGAPGIFHTPQVFFESKGDLSRLKFAPQGLEGDFEGDLENNSFSTDVYPFFGGNPPTVGIQVREAINQQMIEMLFL